MNKDNEDLIKKAIQEVSQEELEKTMPAEEEKFMDETLFEVIYQGIFEAYQENRDAINEMSLPSLINNIFVNTSQSFLSLGAGDASDAIKWFNLAGAALLSTILHIIKNSEEIDEQEQEQG